MKKITSIGIIGSNPTASCLAEITAQKGYQVRIYEVFKEMLNLAMARIEWSLNKSENQKALNDIEAVQDIEMLKGADLIIDSDTASTNRIHSLKKLNTNDYKNSLIALACGIEPISPIALKFINPQRVMGLNFYKPIMKNLLVEVVRTQKTSKQSLETLYGFLKDVKKTPVLSYDQPGIIVERIRRVYLLSALRIMEAGKGFPHQIDSAMKDIGKFPYGPMEMMDRIGLDIDYERSEQIYQLTKEREIFKPSQISKKLVQFGQFGKKSTLGFYIYEDGQIVGENPILRDIVTYLGITPAPPESIFKEIMIPIIEEAKMIVKDISSSPQQIEIAVKLGLEWPKGPFELEKTLKKHAIQTKQPAEWGDAL
jgi:3-hydroxybutyryl-CoA dehydrogenase